MLSNATMVMKLSKLIEEYIGNQHFKFCGFAPTPYGDMNFQKYKFYRSAAANQHFSDIRGSGTHL
jgi:hypothetical protein